MNNSYPEIWQYLKETSKPILLYGMGNGADHILDVLTAGNIPVSGVFASDEFVRGQQFRGFNVTTYQKAKEAFGDMIILVAFGTHLPQVLERINELSSEQEVYAPDVPVYGGSLFTSAYEKMHKNELDRVFNTLADEKSRAVFQCWTEYRLTGKIPPLRRCETTPEEAYRNILIPGANESFLDLGAYTGDTVQEFLLYAKSYSAIYAAEPDVRSFRKLTQNTAALPNVTLWNVGIADVPGTQFFGGNTGRGSSLGKGQKEIEVQSVDALMENKKCTFIKMDVEGAEAAAIRGAENTIRSQKPKMLISAYHRTEDQFALPLQVLSIRSDYQVFLRHYPCLPAWDTAYYFV